MPERTDMNERERRTRELAARLQAALESRRASEQPAAEESARPEAEQTAAAPEVPESARPAATQETPPTTEERPTPRPRQGRDYRGELENALLMAGNDPDERARAIREWMKRHQRHAGAVPPGDRQYAQEQLRLAMGGRPRAQQAEQRVAQRQEQNPVEEYQGLLATEQYTDTGRFRGGLLRWWQRYQGRGDVPQDILDDVRNRLERLKTEAGKGTEVPVTDETKVLIRMAMIKDIGDAMESGIEPKLNAFIRDQVSHFRTDIGQTHFNHDYETELRVEYSARAELARVMNFWNGEPKVSEEDMKRCPLLSRSTYEWLAKDKRTRYVTEPGVERSGGKEVELRREMDKVSGVLYGMMVSGDINIWNTRGEDRLAKYSELAEQLDVSIDSVRLSWQLAEAECWQARMGVSFVSHPAAKVVLLSEYRDFRTRKVPDQPVPGGARLWAEYLEREGNVYPSEKDTYDAEGRRLARVGFEAWSIVVTDETVLDETVPNGRRRKDHRFGRYRKGVVNLFHESGKFPPSLRASLERDLLSADREGKMILAVSDDQVNDGITESEKYLSDDKARDKVRKRVAEAVGGERALLAGKYFSQLEIMLRQPGFGDIALPQTVTMTDISKAAAVLDAIEAFGKIDAAKATTEELVKLRTALTSQLFRFQSNDLNTRNGTNRRQIGFLDSEGNEKEIIFWEVGDGTQERMIKARIETGRLMEEWSRSYIWLLSWANPSNSESRVVGMRDWILLARDVVRTYDENRQWGQFVGYGYGNYDKNELAVDENGAPRRGATQMSKRAAREYIRWFDTVMFDRNKSIIAATKRPMSVERRRKDIKELGTYGGPFFWTEGPLMFSKAWW